MLKKFIIFALLLTAVFFFVSNYIILEKMCHPLGYAWHVHLRNAITIIRGFNLNAFLANPNWVYRYVIMRDTDYPPLYYIISALIFRFFGTSFMFMTSTLFLILLIYCTYKIGKIVKGRTAGLLGAVILSFYPIVYLSSRDFNLEIAQAAMVCLSLYLLMRSEKFSSRKYSLIFGIAFAAGLLIKQQVFLFVAGPLFVVLFAAFKNFKPARAQLINMFFAFSLLALVSFCFFYRNYLNINQLRYFFIRSSITSGIKKAPLNWLNASHILFYFNSLKDYQIGVVNLILVFISIPNFYLRKEYKKYRIFFTAWFITPLIVLTFVPAKYSEYTISYLPVLAIVAALGILSFRSLAIKLGLITIILTFNTFCFFGEISSQYMGYPFDNKPMGNFLESLNARNTPDSNKEFYNGAILKAFNADYKAVTFLKGLLPDRKSKIGIVSYWQWPGFVPATEIELLFLLYTPYEVKNLLFDSMAGGLDKLDAVIFMPSEGVKGEKWLNKDYFVQQINNFNKQQFDRIADKKLKSNQPFFILYCLYDEAALLPKNCFGISKKQLESVVNYYPKLRMIHKIGGIGCRGDILIYKKL